MNKFRCDSLTEPINPFNTRTTNSSKLPLGIDDEPIFIELKEKLGRERINDKNAELFFSPAQTTNRLFFSRGKVLYKTFSNYDAPGIALSVIGFFLVAIQFNQKTEFDLKVFVIGLMCFAIGMIFQKLVSTYAVVDYSCDRIYKEVHIASSCVYKSNSIARRQIIEIGVDHQEKSATLDNMANARSLSAPRPKDIVKKDSFFDNNTPITAPTDSAVILLLSDGKTYYFNGFSGTLSAEVSCNAIAKCISFAWDIPFKKTSAKEKLVAKKIGHKWLFSKESYAKKDFKSIATSIINIILGVGILLGAIVLMFFLILKFV